MDRPLVERTIGAIQRDRLADFFKESEELGDSCFYYALISAHNYLYPNELLPRDITERLRSDATKGKGTKVVDFINEVQRLEQDLKLKVDHVVNHTDKPASFIQKELSIPDTIPVIETTGGVDAPIPGITTGIAFLKSKQGNGGHYIALAENPRFSEYGFPMGGNTEYSKIKDKSLGALTFFLVKDK